MQLKKKFLICLIVTFWTLRGLAILQAQELTKVELNEMIESETYYLGSDVKDAIWEIIQIEREGEVERIESAIVEAVKPVLVDKALCESEVDKLSKKIAEQKSLIPFWIGSSLLVGFSVGIIIFFSCFY